MRRPTSTGPMLAVSGVAILLALSAFAQAPGTPDLSGTWKLNPQKSKFAKRASISPETLIIMCAANSIHIAFASDAKEPTEMYVADGKEHVFLYVAGGGAWVSKAQWKKSVLITEVVARVKGIDGGDDEIMDLRVRWTISADGRVLTRELEDPAQLLVYDKQ
ncbi:MAG TPA: hypothetical protein VIH46_09525 [Candidatus Acidoferrales bacterium]